jgi:hypothetical protein
VYTEGLRGVAAKEKIGPNEAFISVPNKLLISAELARASEIAHVFKNHESLFMTHVER